MLSTSRLVLCAALLLSLVACGDEPGEPADAEPKVTSGLEVAVTALDISFRVPEGWVSFRSAVPPAAADPTLRDLAERMEVKPTKLAERISTGAMVQLYSDKRAKQGLVDSATVIGLLLQELPEEDALQNQLDQLGATKVSMSDAATAAGPALVVRYALERDAGMTVYGQVAYLDIGREVAVITVSSIDEERTEELGQLVLDSVDRT